MWKYEKMNISEVQMMNPLQLAYIGDNAWEMLVRTMLIRKRYNVHHMHKAAVDLVNAKAQHEALRKVTDILSEDERGIVIRGRNSHAKHPSPRNQDPGDYAGATGFEALIGYLYLTGQDERIFDLFDRIMEETVHAR